VRNEQAAKGRRGDAGLMHLAQTQFTEIVEPPAELRIAFPIQAMGCVAQLRRQKCSSRAMICGVFVMGPCCA
jgi:hypothetical protein